MHLLAETRVGEQLDHVDEPAAGAGDPVLPVAGSVEPPKDRDLRELERERAVAVVEHELDLRTLRRLAPGRAAEDHVLHRLAPHRHRRLLAHRPEDGVGHVRLAGAVRPDDDADPWREVESGAIGKRLESLEGDRLQMHGLVLPRIHGLVLPRIHGLVLPGIHGLVLPRIHGLVLPRIHGLVPPGRSPAGITARPSGAWAAALGLTPRSLPARHAPHPARRPSCSAPIRDRPPPRRRRR